VNQLHASGLGHRLQVFYGLFHDLAQLHRAEIQGLPPALDTFEVKNVVDQAHQPIGIG
jgi:hypothetical protein